jgi:hypothetical protein
VLSPGGGPGKGGAGTIDTITTLFFFSQAFSDPNPNYYFPLNFLLEHNSFTEIASFERSW